MVIRVRGTDFSDMHKNSAVSFSPSSRKNAQFIRCAHFSHKAGDVAVLSSSITGDYAKENLPLRLIILGGDGTFNEALQGISSYDNMKIGYIPTGSSNDLARDLGIPKIRSRL